jgi:hypothetical protein
MPSHWPVALAFGVGVIGMFVVAIIVGLRMRRRETAQNLQNINADTVWNEFASLSEARDGSWDRSDLLYGIWQDFSATSLGMIVRNDHDAAVARVSCGVTGVDISLGENRYKVRVGDNLRGTAVLILDPQSGAEAADICSFSRKGSFSSRAVEYSSPDVGVLRISLPWSSPFKALTSTITRDGEPVGKMGTIGRPYFNNGRMLILPVGLPLPIRVFVLAWGTGAGSIRYN